jgi:hypothetical protein
MKTLKESILDDMEITLSKDTAIEHILQTLLSDKIPIGRDKYIELLEIIKEKCEVIDASELEAFSKKNNWSTNRWCKKAFIEQEKPHLKKNDWALIIDKQGRFDCFKTLELWIGKLDDTSKGYSIRACVDDGYMQKSDRTFFEAYGSTDNVYVFPKSLKKIVNDCVKTYKERNYEYYKYK